MHTALRSAVCRKVRIYSTIHCFNSKLIDKLRKMPFKRNSLWTIKKNPKTQRKPGISLFHLNKNTEDHGDDDLRFRTLCPACGGGLSWTKHNSVELVATTHTKHSYSEGIELSQHHPTQLWVQTTEVSDWKETELYTVLLTAGGADGDLDAHLEGRRRFAGRAGREKPFSLEHLAGTNI